MTICNSSSRYPESLTKRAGIFPNAGAPSSREKVVSRGEEISKSPCAISENEKSRKLNFMVNPHSGGAPCDS